MNHDAWNPDLFKFKYQEGDAMMIDLFKPNAEGMLEIMGAVGFHHVPLTTVADLYCTPRGVLSFERAKRSPTTWR